MKKEKLKIKKQNAITLIALVITIIIMLILAGVVLSFTLGEHGIFKTAQESVKKYTNAQSKETADLNYIDSNVENIINGLGIYNEDVKDNYYHGDMEKYIKTHIQVDKIMYIDSINGSDETGDGSVSKPYNSITKAYNSIDCDNTAVVLKKGSYNVTGFANTMCLKNFDNTYWIGDYANCGEVIINILRKF